SRSGSAVPATTLAGLPTGWPSETRPTAAPPLANPTAGRLAHIDRHHLHRPGPVTAESRVFLCCPPRPVSLLVEVVVISMTLPVQDRPEPTPLIRDVGAVALPTPYGEFAARAFEVPTGHVYLALCRGDLSGEEPVLTRLHSECLTGDALGSL